MESINNKVVVITGASSGIGAATARKLVTLGAKVVLAARREEALKALAAELGPNAIFVTTDVTKKEDLDRLIAKAIEAFGQVDVFWSNAGISPLSFFDDGFVDEWDSIIDINIKGVLYGINAVLPHMLERGGGHIVATGSVQSWKTMPGTGVYAASKFAVRGLMDGLRQEVAGKIKVTTLYPGLVATEITSLTKSQKVKAAFGDLKSWPSLHVDAIADAFIYAISQPGNVGANEITIRPLEQAL